MEMALRTSVCLNNIGVFLLTKGEYRQAISTYTDAIGIIKSVFKGPLSSSEREGNVACSSMQPLLQRAHQRAAHAGRFTTIDRPDDISITVVPHDTCPSVLLLGEEQKSMAVAAAGESKRTTPSFILIRIDWLDSESTRVDVQHHWETCVLLYNTAVAYQVAAVMSSEMIEKNTNVSNRLFDMVTTLLSTVEMNDVPSIEYLALIDILITVHRQKSCRSASGSGPFASSEQYRVMLERLESIWGPFLSPSTSVALAA